MLTKKQKTLLVYIRDETRRNEGVCPSFDEMREYMELKSKSGIHRLIKSLETRGFIRRIPNCARAIEVIRMPETYSAQEITPKTAPKTAAKTAPKPENVLHAA